MKSNYSLFIILFLFEWSQADLLYRINTARDTSAFMHSFKPPFAEKLFYWEAGAGTDITPNFIELTPARQGSTGHIWNKKQANMKDWEAVVEFQLVGSSDLGGDGFALWYTQKTGLLGPVYGSNDFWTGLGIFFDTYDNDRQDQNPLISVCVNDGTQSYNTERDGAENALATCSFKIRNTKSPVFARVRYVNKLLTLQIALEKDVLGIPMYHHCVEVRNVDIAPEGFFGLSSHTGEVADAHQIYSMVVKDLSPSNTNLKALMKIWEKSQEILHQQHNDLSENEFKHTVLQQLRQTQEEINMIEMSTLADTNEVKNGLDMVNLLDVLLGNLFSQFRAKMAHGEFSVGSANVVASDPVITANMENNLQKIRVALDTVGSTRTTAGNQISGQIKELTNQIDTITKELLLFQKHVTNTKIQFSRIVTKLESQNNNILEYSSKKENTRSGWWTYFIIALITAPLGGVLTHFFKPKKSKYNSWD